MGVGTGQAGGEEEGGGKGRLCVNGDGLIRSFGGGECSRRKGVERREGGGCCTR